MTEKENKKVEIAEEKGEVQKEIKIDRIRHILKAITWRVIASGTTFGLSMLFFKDDPNAIEKSTGVAIAESAIKMVLYYYHERAWYHVNFGIRHKRRMVRNRRRVRKVRSIFVKR